MPPSLIKKIERRCYRQSEKIFDKCEPPCLESGRGPFKVYIERCIIKCQTEAT